MCLMAPLAQYQWQAVTRQTTTSVWCFSFIIFQSQSECCVCYRLYSGQILHHWIFKQPNETCQAGPVYRHSVAQREKMARERPLLIELISRNTGMVYGGVGVVDCGLPSYF